MKLTVAWAIKILVCILLFFAGYTTHKITDKNEYSIHCPTIPKLPKNAPDMFKQYQEHEGFDNLNEAGCFRGERLYGFYYAWKNKDTYGVYENGWGIDDLVHDYWLTKGGKVYRFCISEHVGLRDAKSYHMDELDSVSVRCLREGNEGHQSHDPNTIKDCFLLLDGEFKKENRVYY